MKTTEQMSHMGGTIASVDPQDRSLTIESLVINKTFKVADDAEIITPSKKHAGLKDLKVGEREEASEGGVGEGERPTANSRESTRMGF